MHTRFGATPLEPTGSDKTVDILNSNASPVAKTSASPAQTITGAAHAKILEALAVRMMSRSMTYWQHFCGPTAYRDNENIPAGYTYLAQMVAHDMVANATPVTRLDSPEELARRDSRQQRLMLETIYGAGPLNTPAPYFTEDTPNGPLILMRLGNVAISEQLRGELRSVEAGIMKGSRARDIPRTQCPFLNEKERPGFTDTLLADPRNDDNLIVSQMTTIFLHLHNFIARKSQPKKGSNPSEHVDHSAFRHFLTVRKSVAAIYRKIIVEDLLPRLLDEEIYKRFTQGGQASMASILPTNAQGGSQVSPGMPPEFSHAVFRCMHAMVRDGYELNDDLTSSGRIAGVRDILDRTSARRPRKVPLARDWIVDWRLFFELDADTRPNFARRMLPDIGHGTLATGTHFPAPTKGRRGGLYFIDLLRGVTGNVSPVQNLINGLPGTDRNRSELLNNAKDRKVKIRRWLEQTITAVTDPDALEFISENPPLYFFSLFEAAHDKCGKRLGILGSTIAAEVIFDAYESTRSVIEKDPKVDAMLKQVFGSTVPNTMPALIAFLQSEKLLRFPVK